MQPPATDKDILSLMKELKGKHSISLPLDYIELLKISNGLEFSGLRIYATHTIPIEGHSDRFIEGILDANAIWWENPDTRKYLFFGEDDLSLFGFNTETGEYEDLDRVSLDAMDNFSNFTSLISQSINTRINALSKSE